MSFLLGKRIGNVEMRIAAKASSANRRGLFIEDVGSNATTSINQHFCRDALVSAYEWFLQTSLKPLYTEILFIFDQGYFSDCIRIPLLNIKLPSVVYAGDLLSFKATVAPDGSFSSNNFVSGDLVGVRNERIVLEDKVLESPSVSVYDSMPTGLLYCTAVSSAVSPNRTQDDFSCAVDGETDFYVLRNKQDISTVNEATIKLVGRSIEISLAGTEISSSRCICVGGYASPIPCIPMEDIAINDGTIVLLQNTYNSIVQPLPSFMQLKLLQYYEEIMSTAVLCYIMGVDDVRTATEMNRLEAMIGFSKQLPPDVRVIFSDNRR